MVLGLGGNVLLGDGGQHNLLHDVLPQSLQGDLLRVLGGDDNSVDPEDKKKSKIIPTGSSDDTWWGCKLRSGSSTRR